MTRRTPRLARWVLLCLLSWMATFVVFLVSTEGAIASHLLGSNSIAITHTARVELRHGEPFGLVSDREPPVHCHIAPDRGMPRSLRAGTAPNSFSLHNPAPQRTDYAWFDGGADIRCTAPTTYLPPERYDDTAQRVLLALSATSSLLLVVVLVQGVRRMRTTSVR
ncbi:hypothetical protein ACVGV2_14075 [Bounagaea algeriensis]